MKAACNLGDVSGKCRGSLALTGRKAEVKTHEGHRLAAGRRAQDIQ